MLIMQASSSSGSSLNWKYDVFLSFRGEDTRNTFTDHLYSALHRKGIFTFKDDKRLKKGEFIGPELLNAIEQSRISIVVFSPNYAGSTWCLEELAKIVQCKELQGQILLSVFYDVDPSEVRKQSGHFGAAFAEKKEKFKENAEMVQKWQAALTNAASMSGWDVRNKPEADCVEKMTEEVMAVLCYPLSAVADDLVGIEPRVEELNEHLSPGLDDVRAIGIWGMPGIGKTTLARAVFNRISNRFDASSFLANVKEVCKKYGLERLQEQLLDQALNADSIKIWNADEGTELIKRRLRHKRVLIVIDDVDQIEQLEKLAGHHDWFGLGSRILITTRDMHLLRLRGVESVYPVDLLNKEESLKLLCQKAFRCDNPPTEYESLSSQTSNYCKGLPLALRVLGCFLFGRSISEWESALARLHEDPEKDIMTILQTSFYGLGKYEKKIFLDIACFFKGESKYYVRHILDACGLHPDIGFSILIEKSFITITNGNIWVHDLLQELGWKIVRDESPTEPSKRSRLWSLDDFNHVGNEPSGTQDVEVEALVLDMQSLGQELKAAPLSKMTSLKLLIVSNVFLLGKLSYLSNELRLLILDSYCSEYFPSSFQPDKLIELNIRYSAIREMWRGQMKVLNNLRSIDLSHCIRLVKTLDFRSTPNLERLNLEGCIQLMEVDESIGVLKMLTVLNLRKCENLTILPASIFSLTCLKIFDLHGCSRLVIQPKTIGQGEDADSGEINPVASQTSSATLILNSLHGVMARGVRLLQPSSWFARRCQQPNSLVLHSLASFQSLVFLDLTSCGDLSKIPEDIGSLTELEVLFLGAGSFVSMPSSISKLSKLREFCLKDSEMLETLPELPTCMIPNSLHCREDGALAANKFKKFLDDRKTRKFHIQFRQDERIKKLMPWSWSLISESFADREADPEYFCQENTSSFLSRLIIFNCPKLTENEDCINLAFIWLGRQLQLQVSGHVQGLVSIVVPGGEIPPWFSVQGSGAGVLVNSNTLDSACMGIALCAEFVVIDSSEGSTDKFSLVCSFFCDTRVPMYCDAVNLTEKGEIKVGMKHRCVIYVPKQYCIQCGWPKVGKINFVVFESNSPRVEVTVCAMRVVTEEDLALIQQHLNEERQASTSTHGGEH